MSDDAKSSAEVWRETPSESEMGTASTTVAPGRDARWLVTAFMWVMRYGIHLAVAGSLLLIGLVLAFDVHVLRSLQIIGLTASPLAVTARHWVGGQAVNLMSGPQMMWLADVDLPNRDGAGVYACPTPRWFEWTVVGGQLWWATPNLMFGRGVDLNVREVAGTRAGSLSDPVLARALGYLRYNRKQLEPKTREGGSLGINPFTIARAATVETMKHVVWAFKKGVLPDDGNALHAEIDSVFEDFDLDGSDSIFDENPTGWMPGDGDPALDPSTDLDQRRK